MAAPKEDRADRLREEEMEKARRYLWVNFVLLGLAVGVFALAFGGRVMSVFSPPAVTPIYRGNEQKPRVSLMINVYWGEEFLPDMLDVLDEFGVKCTFFIGGCWAEKNPALLEEIAVRGHELGNHGYFHIDHKSASYAKNKEEILVTERLIEAVTGKKTNLFAPPSGAFSADTLTAADHLGYRIIMWSRDTIDWRDKDPDLVLTRCTRDIKNGELILMHPTEHTLKALPAVLASLKEQGFSAVTVSENLEESPQPGGAV